MTNTNTEKDREYIETITSKAWGELGIPVGSSTDEIITAFRISSLKSAIGIDRSDYQRKAIAFRFLNSIPLQHKQYSPLDILPTLRPIELDEDPVNVERRNRACAMLEISIQYFEVAQEMWTIPYVNYVINIHYCMRKHVVRRRYSEFLDLHQVLLTKLPVIPHLPKKHWYYKYQLQTPTVRAKDLSRYLNRIISMLAMRGLYSIDLLNFLEVEPIRIRAEEEGRIVALFDRENSTSAKDRYIISSIWLDQWKKFVVDGVGEPPGEIDNSVLFEKDGITIRKHLLMAKDYRAINQEVWQVFHLIYQGGPPIIRKSTNIYGTRSMTRLMAAVCLQKVARRYLAQKMARKQIQQRIVQHPKTEKQNEIREQQEAHFQTMHSILMCVRQEEEKIAQNASKTIQNFLRRANIRKKKYSSKPLPNIQSNQEVEEKSETLLDKVSSLRDLCNISSEETKLAYFINFMQNGVTLSKFKKWTKNKSLVLFINESGSELFWNSQNSRHFIPFSTIKSVSMEITGHVSPRMTNLHTFAITTANKLLVLSCCTSEERDLMVWGLSCLLEEAKANEASGGFIDSYGVLRRKPAHARKLIRKADNLLEKAFSRRLSSRDPFVKQTSPRRKTLLF